MITCQQLTELATAYVEGTLEPGDRAQLEAHLDTCEWCGIHIEQIRATVTICAQIESESLSPAAREELAAAFLSWKSAR